MNTIETRTNASFFSFGTLILIALVFLGGFAAFYRFANGLGAATDLSDNVPWGLWIACDVLSGVALAAGGFTITAAVYIFNMKKYKPIARPAILTAFIGYLMVIVGITIDIGQPLRLWHPLVMWQHRSVMFEVVICVALYTAVLALEFAPPFLERFKLHGLLKVLKFFTFPLVIAGITLSFLHQSSLGALYLIVPAKMNKLWYSPVMPQMFYLSAICVGLAMTNFETIMSASVFKREYEHDIIRGLAKGTSIALLIYLIVKVIDLQVRGALPLLFEGSAASKMYLVEIVAGVIVPMVMLWIRSVRESIGGVLFATILVIAGVLLNRFNTNFFAEISNGVSYFPTWMELAITVGLISLGVFLYRLAVIYLPVFQSETGH